MSKLSFTHLKFCFLFNLKLILILKLIHFYFRLVLAFMLNFNFKYNFVFNLNLDFNFQKLIAGKIKIPALFFTLFRLCWKTHLLRVLLELKASKFRFQVLLLCRLSKRLC